MIESSSDEGSGNGSDCSDYFYEEENIEKIVSLEISFWKMESRTQS